MNTPVLYDAAQSGGNLSTFQKDWFSPSWQRIKCGGSTFRNPGFLLDYTALHPRTKSLDMCPCLRVAWEMLNRLMDFDETWYERYAT